MDHVDTFHRSDGFDIFEPLRRFDHANDERVLRQRRDRVWH
jgi:hypothetical protein